MFTIVILAERPFDWTHAEFVDWWRGEHANATRQLPQLRAWVHSDVNSPVEPLSTGWNAMAVLSFETAEHRRRALRSDQWSELMSHHGMTSGRRIVLMGDERSMPALATDSGA